MSAPANLASPADRLIAAIIDGVILGVVTGILNGIATATGSTTLALLFSLVNLVISIGYYVYFWSFDNPYTTKGQTIGKKLRGIKIIKTDGSDLTPKDAVLRYVGYIVSSIVIMLGFIWIFIDANKQGWHDKIAGTYVVKA